MYGSLSPSSLDPPKVEQDSLLNPYSTKKKKSKARQKFVTAAHAARAARRIRSSTKQKPGVFGNLFQAKSATTKKKSPRASVVTQSQGHSFVYTCLNSKSHSWQANIFRKFLSFVIVCDVLVFIASTDVRLNNEQYDDYFYMAEGITSTLFLMEYVARVVVIYESKKYKKHGRIWGRLLYMTTSWSAVIDAIATFPFFLELILGVDFPRLTYLRFWRLLRIQRTESFSKAADCCIRVIYYNREILQVAAVMCVYLVLFTAFLLYFLRPKVSSGEEFDGFESIGATMYMSTLMLTGQGGPEGDLPWYTKGIVLLTGVFSIGMFAIPASMLTWGFEAEAQRVAARSRQRLKHQETTTESSSSSDGDSSSSVSTSDEEYLKIIAGEEDSQDETYLEGRTRQEQAALTDLLDKFRQADADDTGTLTRAEFVELLDAASTSTSRGSLLEQAAAKQSSSGSLLQQQTAATSSSAVAAIDSASLQELTGRMDKLEQTMNDTNKRLDLIVKLLQTQ